MLTLRQAAEQALEALEWSWGGEPLGTKERDAITALRAALAEPTCDSPSWCQQYGQCHRHLVGVPTLPGCGADQPQSTHWEGCEEFHPMCAAAKQVGCDHCRHPLYAGIRCSSCGRWNEVVE